MLLYVGALSYSGAPACLSHVLSMGDREQGAQPTHGTLAGHALSFFGLNPRAMRLLNGARQWDAWSES